MPADVSLLVGRDELLMDADALLTAILGSAGVPAVLSLYGAAGMGKSAVAVRVPDSEDERSALFRSQVAERAVLLVLDHAVGVAQLRPLIPAGSRCGVVITSRRPMLGLEDADHRELGGLSDKLSRQLLVELAHGQVADASLAEIIGTVSAYRWRCGSSVFSWLSPVARTPGP